MKEFFGFGGYQRKIEGYLSWQHLLFVTILMAIMVALAIFLGKKYKNKELKEKNKILIISSILIDSLELFKIIILCIRGHSLIHILYNLPLFLCSIQLITLPLASFSKGRVKEASLDFIFMFGILGAVLGTYGAGNNYASYPVLSFDNVVSGVTHSISGFASLYIGISGMASMKKENIPISFAIITSFCVLAYIANVLLDYNYMFLMRGDGTPYDILYNLVNGNKFFYPFFVLLLFIAYIFIFYIVLFTIRKKKDKKIDNE
mgnify:CR=1 FL=1